MHEHICSSFDHPPPPLPPPASYQNQAIKPPRLKLSIILNYFPFFWRKLFNENIDLMYLVTPTDLYQLVNVP